MLSPAIKKPADLELITIYEISKILSSSLDFPKTVHGVLNVLLSHLNMHHGLVSMVHESGKLHLIGASAATEDGYRPLKMAEEICIKVFKGGSPIVVPDIAEDPLFRKCAAIRVRRVALACRTLRARRRALSMW